MTPDERELLTTFLRDLGQARAGAKDPEAAALIDQAFSANPDAAYLIVQHTILSDQALHAAQARIADLEAQQAAPAPAASFLGGSPWSAMAASTAVPTTAAQPSPFAPTGGLGSFLRNVGTTAMGVAGGEMLFDGLAGLFGGHRGFGLGGMGYGGGYGAPMENVTINNYDDGGNGGGDWGGGSDYSDNS